MNDLDRKIAELKGMPVDGEVTHWPVGEDDKGKLFPTGDPIPQNWGWSTSDAKALELVDELVYDAPNRMARFRFILISWNATAIKPARWEARFEPYETDEGRTYTSSGHRFDGQAPTRPEAICRAYIAAREWMKERAAG